VKKRITYSAADYSFGSSYSKTIPMHKPKSHRADAQQTCIVQNNVWHKTEQKTTK
jgi:hypothetical protein